MNPNLDIETTQNVKIGFPIASVGERILSLMIDLTLLSIFYLCSFVLLPTFKLSMIISSVIIAFYSLFCESVFNGQSLGKKIMKIKVIRLDGNSPHFTNYLIRWTFRLVDILITQGVCAILTVVLRNKGQRLGDILAGTMVIKIQDQQKLNKNLLIDVPTSYQIVFPAAQALNFDDITRFGTVINKIKVSQDSMDIESFGSQAKKKICDRLNIQTEMGPEEFFNTLIKDYNALNREIK